MKPLHKVVTRTYHSCVYCCLLCGTLSHTHTHTSIYSLSLLKIHKIDCIHTFKQFGISFLAFSPALFTFIEKVLQSFRQAFMSTSFQKYWKHWIQCFSIFPQIPKIYCYCYCCSTQNKVIFQETNTFHSFLSTIKIISTASVLQQCELCIFKLLKHSFQFQTYHCPNKIVLKTI